VNSLDEHVHEVDLAEAESIGVRDIEESALGGAVNTTSTSLLESQLLQDVAEALVLRDFWDFNVNTASNSGTEVGWAG